MASNLYRLALILPLWQCAGAEVPMADPTRPPPNLTVKEETNADRVPLNVSLIVIGPSGRHAVVNGAEVKIGDTIGGYQVVAIDHRQLVLRRNGVDSILTILPKHEIKR